MTFENFKFDSASTGGSSTEEGWSKVAGEGGDKRTARMNTFFNERKTILIAGRLLSQKFHGKTAAEWLMETDPTTGKGFQIPMTGLILNGVEYPLQDGYNLSLASCSSLWACPACGSAHGSGVKPYSKRVSVKGLEANKFYYSLDTQELFSISESCWETYVRGLNKIKGRFIDPPAPKSRPQSQEPKLISA